MINTSCGEDRSVPVDVVERRRRILGGGRRQGLAPFAFKSLILINASCGVTKLSLFTSRLFDRFCQADGGRGVMVSVTVDVAAPPLPSST